MNAIEFAAFHLNFAGLARTDSDAHRVEVLLEFINSHIAPDHHAGLEHHTFLLKNVYTAINDMLFHLEVRHTVAQEAAKAISRFVQHDAVTALVETVGGGKASGAAADNSDLLAAAAGRGLRLPVTFGGGAF